MKKSFPLKVDGKKSERVIESIKFEVRKYLKRERRKALPEGVDFWDFDCKVGEDTKPAQSLHVAEVPKAIEAAFANEWTSIYLEILAKPAKRSKKVKEKKSVSGSAED